MRTAHVVFAIPDHQAGTHVLNTQLCTGIAQDFRFVVARAVQFSPGHKGEKAVDPEMLQNPPGKGFRLRGGDAESAPQSLKPAQKVRNAVIKAIFKNPLDAVVFAVFLDSQIHARCVIVEKRRKGIV